MTNVQQFKQAERVLIPKGRDMGIVLDWITQQDMTPPVPPGNNRRCLHRQS